MGAKGGVFWLPMCSHFVERNVQFNHPHGQYGGEALGIYLEEKKNKILTDIVFPTKSTFLVGCGVSDALSFLSADVPAPVSASVPPETGPSQKAGGEALNSFMMKLSVTNARVLQQYTWGNMREGSVLQLSGVERLSSSLSSSLFQPPALSPPFFLLPNPQSSERDTEMKGIPCADSYIVSSWSHFCF